MAALQTHGSGYSHLILLALATLLAIVLLLLAGDSAALSSLIG